MCVPLFASICSIKPPKITSAVFSVIARSGFCFDYGSDSDSGSGSDSDSDSDSGSDSGSDFYSGSCFGCS